MDIVKIVFSSMSVLFITVILKKISPDYAFLASCVANIAICFFSLSLLFPVFEEINSFSSKYGVTSLCDTMFKSAGVCLLCSFGADICRDCSENSLASKIELAGKCTIIAYSLPLIKEVFEYAKAFIS